MQSIEREEVQQLLHTHDDLVVLEVLGSDHYERGHLPGALNAAVDELFEERVERLVPELDRTVVVYAADHADLAAARVAAVRLEALGFEHVYIYEGGKADWRAAGLPLEQGRQVETDTRHPQPPLGPRHPRYPGGRDEAAG